MHRLFNYTRQQKFVARVLSSFAASASSPPKFPQKILPKGVLNPALSVDSGTRRMMRTEPVHYDDHNDCGTHSEEKLRFDLAVAHRLTARYNYDMLTWNHISHRFRDGCLITPGNKLFQDINPEDLLISSTNIT